ncbi:MAG: alpha/beta hydrolase [Candidatus Competibacteraceae bacterium]|nr:alpha/beta hydrolase [Candidatus Competibacteraceae bacterium]MBK7982089.1 alpha/beta hydrolase [Candidatus Competibacteraceae bacterium]MBK8899303.1 alpha/beta hydrolase [Candidatus Competibacteraceae bacterium]MBK8963401.1 alpha/beta hydrolase [Candidatus Competibacteraceae bacterium]
MRRALAVGATVGLILGGMLMALLAAGERLVYFPRPLGPSEGQAVLSRHPQAIEVTVPTADGVRLHGWQLPGGDGPARPLVLYFGGNAEEVSWMLEFGTVFTGWDLVLLNYRGYGLSAGNPSQRALLADALTIYDHFTRQPNIDGGRVVVVGRSLGSGVASYLASQRPVRGVLLVTPFDSITEVARGLYPFLPVRWVLGDLYDSAALAPKLTTPLRMIVAGRDEVIAGRHSQRLFEVWGGPKDLVMIANAGHNDVRGYREYWQAIRDFLQR